MKARLVPVYFDPGRDGDFDVQLAALGKLLGDVAQFLPPAPLGADLGDADAAVFPQMLGEGYRRLGDFRKIGLPILIATSQFGTLSMWDWEIIDYLRSEGVQTIAPYTLEQCRAACRALATRRQLEGTKFLVFQDNPGQGAQASIFKRFYWWEDQCTRRMADRFGVTVVRESFKDLAAQARAIPAARARAAARELTFNRAGLGEREIDGAVRLYLAVRSRLDQDPGIRAAGINCLNESHFCDSTPCLAWAMLFEHRGVLWGCEADTLSMLTQFVLGQSLGCPLMLTNLYPFLLGQAALHHERIDAFPPVDGPPGDHVLVAHCGYMGLMPPSLATTWTLRPKVLAIVDDHAVAIDARFPAGPVTLAKLHADMSRMTVAAGELTGFAEYPNSDCRVGGIIRVRDGHKLMTSLASHHYVLLAGHHRADIENLGKVFGLKIEQI
jgi:hypothetical protein